MQQYLPFTVLKLLSFSEHCHHRIRLQQYLPFTVLKLIVLFIRIVFGITLQQYLPFTVLKHMPITSNWAIVMLQQYLPFTVLKRYENQKASVIRYVATVLTVYGIETP